MTFCTASGFLWQHLSSFIKNKIKQSKNKAICYLILVFNVLKEGGVASSQKIHQGRCFTFIKGQRDNCLYSKMNLPVFYIPCLKATREKIFKKKVRGDFNIHGMYQIFLGCCFPSKIKNIWCFKPPVPLVSQKNPILSIEYWHGWLLLKMPSKGVFSSNQPCEYFMERTVFLAHQRYRRLKTS